MARTLTT